MTKIYMPYYGSKTVKWFEVGVPASPYRLGHSDQESCNPRSQPLECDNSTCGTCATCGQIKVMILLDKA